MRLLIAAAVMVLAGCAAPQKVMLYKDGGTDAEYKQALAQCEYEVSAVTQGTDYSYHSMLGQELDRTSRQRDLGLKCMAARGWAPR